jgi:hypothetical protein
MKQTQYQKSPSPKSLFERFLQRQTHKPSAVQIQKWEDEGGGLAPSEHDMLVPDENDHVSRKMRLYFARAWRAITKNTNSLQNEEKL